MKKFSDRQAVMFGVWGLKTSLGQFGRKAFGKGIIKALVEKALVYICASWAQKPYQVISPEPWL